MTASRHRKTDAPILGGSSVVLLLWMLGCVACNNSEDNTGGHTDTDTVLEGMVENVTDHRWGIPSECQVDEDCDDGDHCTIEACARGRCVFRHAFEPLYTQDLDFDDPVTDAAIIGNRLLVATNGQPPEVHIYNVPSMNLAEITYRESTATRYGVLAMDATWSGFATVYGEGGMEIFSNDDISSPVSRWQVDTGLLEQLDSVVGAAVSNSQIWLAGYEEGVTLLMVDGENISRRGTVDTVGRAVAVASRGNTAFVADSLGGAVSIYLENDVPVVGQPIETVGRVVDVDANRSSGIMAEYGAGFSLVDLSQNSAPHRLTRVETASPVVAARMIGSQTALVFTKAGELMRVGFLNFRSPRLMERIQLPGKPRVSGVDFYDAMGVIVFEDGSLTLVHNGCSYE
ncbi:MAG: hypothetical protein JXX14_23630 [Deltaproteobacteria bacterium]|nr:hypothetical protein [Deltaproteobacteria bacterium]